MFMMEAVRLSYAVCALEIRAEGVGMSLIVGIFVVYNTVVPL